VLGTIRWSAAVSPMLPSGQCEDGCVHAVFGHFSRNKCNHLEHLEM
jgi:hypothetical protein